MKRYDYIYLGLHIILLSAIISFVLLLAHYLANYLDENTEDIERWWTAMHNFVGEKYNEFVDKYAPRD